MIRLKLFILLSIIPMSLKAQLIVELVSAETWRPASDAIVNSQSLLSPQKKIKVISNENVSIEDISFPVSLQVQNLRFLNSRDTVYQHEKKTLQLYNNTVFLGEVALTGQYIVQSVPNAVYDIITISSERVEARGTVSLQDVLSNALNIRFSRKNTIGNTRFNMQGLSGQSVKVLMISYSGDENEVKSSTINFTNQKAGLSDDSPMVNVSRSAPSNGSLTLNLSVNDLTYGENEDFYMIPVMSGNELVLSFYAPDGALTKAAFGEITADEATSKVFIVRREGDNRNWKKVKVFQLGDNYTIQYDDINATAFQAVEITKYDTFNFSFFDLDNGVESIEPEKEAWDFKYNTFTEALNLGGLGLAISYSFKDFITLNRHNTCAVQVLAEDITFEAFSVQNISGLAFNNEIDVIGEN
ncbi:MAG: Plug domain-containing protein [Bacteroidota bacterium]